jgi:5-methylcytosine-specific restriction protein A
MAERLRGRAGVEQRARRLAAEPLCRKCASKGVVRAATVPDHIIALVNGGEDVDSNIQCLCRWHHEAKTREDLGQRQRVEIDPDGWPVTP